MVTLSLWSRRCEWASSRTGPSMWSLTPLRSTGQSHSRGRGLEGFWLFFKSWIFRFANLECDKWPQWGSKQCWRSPSSPRWFRRRFLRTQWRSSRCTARISGRFAPSSHHIERHMHNAHVNARCNDWTIATLQKIIEGLLPCTECPASHGFPPCPPIQSWGWTETVKKCWNILVSKITKQTLKSALFPHLIFKKSKCDAAVGLLCVDCSLTWGSDPRLTKIW